LEFNAICPEEELQKALTEFMVEVGKQKFKPTPPNHRGKDV